MNKSELLPTFDWQLKLQKKIKNLCRRTSLEYYRHILVKSCNPKHHSAGIVTYSNATDSRFIFQSLPHLPNTKNIPLTHYMEKMNYILELS